VRPHVTRAGSAIPVKFSLGGYRGLQIFEAGYPGSVLIACDSSAPLDPVEETVTAGSSGLSYDAATDTYTRLRASRRLVKSAFEVQPRSRYGSLRLMNWW
jgi:hypothetical protein